MFNFFKKIFLRNKKNNKKSIVNIQEYSKAFAKRFHVMRYPYRDGLTFEKRYFTKVIDKFTLKRFDIIGDPKTFADYVIREYDDNFPVDQMNAVLFNCYTENGAPSVDAQTQRKKDNCCVSAASLASSTVTLWESHYCEDIPAPSTSSSYSCNSSSYNDDCSSSPSCDCSCD